LNNDYKCDIFSRRGFKIHITFTEMSLRRTISYWFYLYELS